MLSSTECITWLVVFLTESIAIVTVNLLTIVIFIKNSNLRTRSLYLLIHFTVADLFVGVFSGSVSVSVTSYKSIILRKYNLYY